MATSKPERLPGIADWNTYGGGTFAAPGKYSYDIKRDGQTYSISPYSAKYNSNRHLGYHVSVFPGVPAQGHKQLGQFRNLSDAVKAAREYHMSKVLVPSTNNPLHLHFKNYSVRCDGKDYGPYTTRGKAKKVATTISRICMKPAQILGHVGKANPRRTERKANPCRKHNRRRNGEHEARELELYIENDAQLHRSQEVPIQKNLVTKIARGIYNHAGAVKLYGYLMESGAKKYQKDHGTPDQPWHQMFSVADRKAAAERFANAFEVEAKLGNYNHLLPKKYQKMLPK